MDYLRQERNPEEDAYDGDFEVPEHGGVPEKRYLDAYENHTYSAASVPEIGMQSPVPFKKSTEVLTPTDKWERKYNGRLLIFYSIVVVVLMIPIAGAIINGIPVYDFNTETSKVQAYEVSTAETFEDCPNNMFLCRDKHKCINHFKLCDSEKDCSDGSDEDLRICDITCDFETLFGCGYKNVSSTDRWKQIYSATSGFLDSSDFGSFMLAYPSEYFPMKMQSPKANVQENKCLRFDYYGLIMFAYPSEYYRMKMQSPTVTVRENKCLRFDYYSTGKLTVTLDSPSAMKWLDKSRHKYWREGQLEVLPGDTVVYITAEWNGLDSLVAIDNIKLLDGTCSDKLLKCPDKMAPCGDNYKCIAKATFCDSETDCIDGSDEDFYYCNFSIQCDFEKKSCGYTHASNSEIRWNQRTGSQFTRPQFDRTYGTQQGHFMVVSDNSDPKGYLVDSEKRRRLIGYNNASLISPEEEVQSESCVEFYYYLNGSEVRPSPLSAQLLVYIISDNRKILAWYDNVNRTINGWLKGWVLVPQGRVRIIFEGKTTTTLAVWPGVVAIDEISIKPGPCSEPPHCGSNAFKCVTSRVCIPAYLQCDGENDCFDGSDENGCTSKPDYEVILANGDGSYGTLAIFYHGKWIPVCYASGDTLAPLTCKKLGYKGRYQKDYANSWHKPVSHNMNITCQVTHTDFSQCSMTASYCDLFQSILCSNTDCFSGERICANSSKCILEQYYCDGITDCPFADDEKNCANCTISEFVCTNHECIPISQRCDGVPQCKDASDEYRCVIVEDNTKDVFAFHSTSQKYFPVCSSNMDASLAKLLCNLSGKGSQTSFWPGKRTDEGMRVIPYSSVSNTVIPGYRLSIESCRSTHLKCKRIECGTCTMTGHEFRVLFGRKAIPGQFPWQIALYGNGTFLCGGSIIHPSWVLTAAHCFDDSSYSYNVKLGTVDLDSTFQGLTKQVSRIRVHPSYNRTNAFNDIALLYFTTPIVMNDYVRPVCLSSKIFYQELLNQGPNAECYISGWGDTEQRIFYGKLFYERISQLRMTIVQLIANEECKQIHTRGIPNTVVCVDNSNIGTPACFDWILLILKSND